MILISPALEIAASLPAAAPASRPAPAVAGRPGRTDASAGPSFRDELRAAEGAPGRDDPAKIELREGNAERADSNCGAERTERCAQERRDDACPQEGDRSHARELVAALLTACGITPDPPVEGSLLPEPDSAAAGEGQTELPAGLLELLKDIRTLGEASGPGVAGGAEIARMVDGLSAMASANARAALPGEIHQLLRDLREHLSGVVWGRAVKDAEAAEAMPAPGPMPAETAGSGASVMGCAPADALAGEAGTSIAARAAVQAEAEKTAAALKPATDRRPAAPATGAGSETGPPAEAAERPAFAPAAPVRPAGQRPETPASPELRGQVGQDAGSVPETGREPVAADPRPELKATAVEELPASDAAESGTAAEPAPADARLARLHDGRPERVAETGAAAKDKDAAGASRAGVFDQIVQRAVLQVKNEQSEIKIDLKPEFLGNVPPPAALRTPKPGAESGPARGRGQRPLPRAPAAAGKGRGPPRRHRAGRRRG